MVTLTEEEMQSLIRNETRLKAALRECSAFACMYDGDIGREICDLVAETLKA